MSRARRMLHAIRAGGNRAAADDGVSLVEVMMAMMFMGVGLLAVVQMIPMGLSSVTEAKVRTSAIQSAQQRMDELRAEGYSAPELTAGSYTETVGKYSLSWSITDSDPVPGNKGVYMTVTWNNHKGTQSVDLSTYVSAE